MELLLEMVHLISMW